MVSTIHAVAIHHLIRENKDEVYKIESGNDAITVTDTVKRLVEDIHKLYSKRPSKSYGKFSTNITNYPTSMHLKKYLENKNFSLFTMSLMTTLAKEAGAKTGSTGGHVFFCHFDKDDKQFFLVVIVSDKLSVALTEAKTLRDIKHLDVDGFRFAGRVDLTGWDANEERYIGFLKGKGTVSDYFKDFLGCDTTIQSRIETTNLVTALKNFADSRSFNSSKRAEFMEKALTICDRDAKADKPVDFRVLSNELYPEAPDDLIEVLSNPDLKLNDGFIADRRALKSLVNFKRKTSDWAVEFERKSLQNGMVKFNSTDKSITLYAVPDEMLKELSEEIGNE